MRSHAKLRLNESLARLARWLGFDRNPLRRGTDRVEGALRLVMIILAVLAVPAASVAAGRWADHYALHRPGMLFLADRYFFGHALWQRKRLTPVLICSGG